MKYRHPHNVLFVDGAMLDGVPAVDVQAAIQAAWCADPTFAEQLARRYGLYDKVCLRCANAHLAALEPTQILKDMLGGLAYQMCVACLAFETQERLRKFVKRVAITNPCAEIALPLAGTCGFSEIKP